MFRCSLCGCAAVLEREREGKARRVGESTIWIWTEGRRGEARPSSPWSTSLARSSPAHDHDPVHPERAHPPAAPAHTRTRLAPLRHRPLPSSSSSAVLPDPPLPRPPSAARKMQHAAPLAGSEPQEFPFTASTAPSASSPYPSPRPSPIGDRRRSSMMAAPASPSPVVRFGIDAETVRRHEAEQVGYADKRQACVPSLWSRAMPRGSPQVGRARR